MHIKYIFMYREIKVCSELECNWGNFQVLVFSELIFESGEELRIHFESKLFEVLNLHLKIFLFVTGPLFHFGVPCIDLFNVFSW